jgi:hypothetical protein
LFHKKLLESLLMRKTYGKTDQIRDAGSSRTHGRCPCISRQKKHVTY